MLIQELLRTCANRKVAAAAVSSIGRKFFDEVQTAAAALDMSVGDYVAQAVTRFTLWGEEAELRSVASAMQGSQEPILAGLHRLICIMMTSDGATSERRLRERMPRIPTHLCALGIDARREYRS